MSQQLVKELIPFTTNNIYRQYFEEFYDFGDANNYKQSTTSTTSSGVSFNGLNPNFVFPTKNINKIEQDGLLIDGYNCTITVPHSQDFTICMGIEFLETSNFNLYSVVTNQNTKTQLNYDSRLRRLNLKTNRGTSNITVPSSFFYKFSCYWWW